MKAKVNKVTIHLTRDAVFATDAAALVNATDASLSLSPELIEKAGVEVARECALIGWCEVGTAAITGAGTLAAKKLIHAVGPRWGEGSERGKLASVTWDCLRLAEANRLRSVALPAISTGTLGYPVENCATTMLGQIVNFSFEDLKHLRRVILCLPDELTFEAFRREFERQLADLRQSGAATV